MKKLLMLSTTGVVSLWLFGWSSGNSSAWAGDETKKDETQSVPEKKDADAGAFKEGLKTENKAKILAEFFQVPEATVLELRNKEMGWGEISHLLAIAQKAGQTIETILALRQSGMGWGKIAQKYNLKLGEINREVQTVKHEFKKVENQTKLERKERKAEEKSQRRMDKPFHPEKSERTEHLDKFHAEQPKPERIERSERPIKTR